MRQASDAQRSYSEAHDRLYRQASRVAKLGAWECDIASERLLWTDDVYDLFQLPVGSRLKRSTIVDLYDEQSRHEMEFMRAEVIRTGQSFAMDAKIRTCRGESRWIRLSADVAYDGARPVRIFGAKQDVTDRMEALACLKQLAERDTLTGLANRGTFDAHYQRIVQDEVNHGFVSALILIDLDHFKQINDNFGHAAGDECLRQVAGRLCSAFAETVLIARIGGDEFAVFLRAQVEPASIERMIRRASCLLRKPFLWNRRRVEISASIGARMLARPRVRKLSALFLDADSALYAAKKAGRDTVRIFGEMDCPGVDAP